MTQRRLTTQKYYLCIDFKSFYASVECVDRGLDPLTSHLVVADKERGRSTICLAITPALKKLGIPNRCRLFAIPKDLDCHIAPPRMKRYMEVSTYIYSLYLRYVSPQDIHVYSIDECFIDTTPYLTLYRTNVRSFAKTLLKAVLDETGIYATAGIGTNLFLAKIALDITAKHSPENIGFLDEDSFKREVWFHRPLTDIWNIGPGIARRLAKHGVYDLAGVCATNEKVLYKEFGINAEFLIDHAWGQEPCTIAEIHAYVPEGHSLTNGQVLPSDYCTEDTQMVMHEMIDASVLDLITQGLAAKSISLFIGYARPKDRPTTMFPRHFHERTGGTRKLPRLTNSARVLKHHFDALFDETAIPGRAIKRIHIGFGGLLPEKFAAPTLFDDIEAERKERNQQEAVIAIREKFGKNALLKGTSLQEKATARERNNQIGGHRA